MLERKTTCKVSLSNWWGGHERGMRSGTLNVPGIVGFGKALEIAINEMDQDTNHVIGLRKIVGWYKCKVRWNLY